MTSDVATVCVCVVCVLGVEWFFCYFSCNHTHTRVAHSPFARSRLHVMCVLCVLCVMRDVCVPGGLREQPRGGGSPQRNHSHVRLHNNNNNNNNSTHTGSTPDPLRLSARFPVLNSHSTQVATAGNVSVMVSDAHHTVASRTSHRIQFRVTRQSHSHPSRSHISHLFRTTRQKTTHTHTHTHTLTRAHTHARAHTHTHARSTDRLHTSANATPPDR